MTYQKDFKLKMKWVKILLNNSPSKIGQYIYNLEIVKIEKRRRQANSTILFRSYLLSIPYEILKFTKEKLQNRQICGKGEF